MSSVFLKCVDSTELYTLLYIIYCTLLFSIELMKYIYIYKGNRKTLFFLPISAQKTILLLLIQNSLSLYT